MDPDPVGCMVLSVAADTAASPSLASILLRVAILFVLILVNAFFAMSEIAVLGLNDNKVERMAEDGDKRARKVLKLTENSSRFLSTIQIGVTLAGFLASAAAADGFAPMIAEALSKHITFVTKGFLSTLSLIVVTLITSYFSLVFGELVPKKIALAKSEKVSFAIAGFLNGFMKLTRPFVALLSVSTNAVCRIIGLDPTAEENAVTEEEILMMVDAGEEKGVLENSQAEMINNIFEFDDLDAGDIMTHRVDMTAVEESESVSDVIALATEEGYSRIPVYDDDPDNIIGVVYVKDLLKFVGKELPEDETIRNYMREAYFVPEAKKCGQLFKEMSERHLQIAVVVDEYGGTAGIVTLEDIVEAIVGDIQDEFDTEDDEISRINDSTFTVDGTTDIDEIEDLTGHSLPEGDYDTVAGFILSRLGYLPKDGAFDEVESDGLKLTVMKVSDRRIDKVKIEILPEPEAPDEAEDARPARRDRRGAADDA